jgi:hypothetical protein
MQDQDAPRLSDLVGMRLESTPFEMPAFHTQHGGLPMTIVPFEPAYAFQRKPGGVLIRYGPQRQKDGWLRDTYQALLLENDTIVDTAQGLFHKHPSWVTPDPRLGEIADDFEAGLLVGRGSPDIPMFIANGDPRWLWGLQSIRRTDARTFYRRCAPLERHGVSPGAEVDGGVILRYVNQGPSDPTDTLWRRHYEFRTGSNQPVEQPQMIELHYSKDENAVWMFGVNDGEMTPEMPSEDRPPTAIGVDPDGVTVSIHKDSALGDSKDRMWSVVLTDIELESLTQTLGWVLPFPDPTLTRLDPTEAFLKDPYGI